jgi:hypothetical protein
MPTTMSITSASHASHRSHKSHPTQTDPADASHCPPSPKRAPSANRFLFLTDFNGFNGFIFFQPHSASRMPPLAFRLNPGSSQSSPPREQPTITWRTSGETPAPPDTSPVKGRRTSGEYPANRRRICRLILATRSKPSPRLAKKFVSLRAYRNPDATLTAPLQTLYRTIPEPFQRRYKPIPEPFRKGSKIRALCSSRWHFETFGHPPRLRQKCGMHAWCGQ